MPKRTDRNQASIVAGLREFGASVKDVHIVGGFFDILVGWCGRDCKMEVKSEHGRLTPAEKRFHATWKGAPTYIVTSLEEAIQILQDVCGEV